MIKEIANALPNEIAESLRNRFLSSDYDQIIQQRKVKFSLEKNDEFLHYPEKSEIFSANFYRSRYLEGSDIVQDAFTNNIKPIIEENLGIHITKHDLRCYKMESGGYFRLHKDDYISRYGFQLYLSKNWKWDWGGLLLVLQKDLPPQIEIPEFNKLIIMKHGDIDLPHAVTQVTEFALEPRLMLVGFVE